jgi:nucleotide-binding universal stress UspA family protein
MKRILIAIDGSPVAAHAAEVGIELARALEAEVGFVHVLDPSLYAIPNSSVSASELLAVSERDRKRLLAEFRERAALAPTALEFAREGKPADEIVSSAQEWQADMIVVGSHGRGGLGRALLGSVADSVTRHAPCPVLVVRARS